MSTATAASDVLVPDIGDFADVPIIEMLVSPGDTVAAEDPLVTLESDKATMDVPSPMEGVVQEIKVSVGDTSREGTLLLTLGAPDEADAEQAAESAGRAPRRQQPARGRGGTGRAQRARRAGPAPVRDAEAAERRPPTPARGVRRLARELGVDLAQVSGLRAQGPDHRRRRRARPRRAAPARRARPRAPSGGDSGLELLPWPTVDFSKYGEVEVVPLSRIQKISGREPRAQLGDASRTSRTTTRRTSPSSRRSASARTRSTRSRACRLTMLAFLIKACVAGAEGVPGLQRLARRRRT